MTAQPVVQLSSAAGDDAVRPFQVDGLNVRGRAIQMGPALDTLLGRHDYPASVSKLIAEAVVLTALLGASLKFDGRFILQTKTDGPVRMLVVDFRTPGDLRAYASFDRQAVEAADADGEAKPAELLGTGILAMTIDPGRDMNRYQGVVALEGDSLEDVAHAYFRQSEQIPTKVRLAAAEMLVPADGGPRRLWRAGGILAQYLPAVGEPLPRADLPGGDAPEGADDASDSEAEPDSWHEARLLLQTAEDHELLDPEVPVERLLYRLFHERGVRVYEPTAVRDQCSCNRDRIDSMLHSFGAQAIDESVENGIIRVKCEFCGTSYDFDPDEFRDSEGSPAD